MSSPVDLLREFRAAIKANREADEVLAIACDLLAERATGWAGDELYLADCEYIPLLPRMDPPVHNRALSGRLDL